MRSNRELLSMSKKVELMKGLISMATITLSPDEADRFIDYVWDRSVMKNNARLEKMAHKQKYVRGLGLGTTRILHPADTFTSADYKKSLDHDSILLDSEELRACIVVYDRDLEDITVVSGAEFKNMVMGMVTKKLAEELDELYWIADAQSLSGFAATDARSKIDGWRYRLDHSQSGETYENDVTGSTVILDASNTVTAKAASYTLTTSQGIAEQNSSDPYNWEFKFGKMIQHLPSQYKTGGLANLRFFLNDQIEQNYIDALAARSTILGDNAILGTAPLKYGLVPIVTCPLMPTTMKIDTVDTQKEALKADGTLTDCLLTHANNLIIGVQLEIQVEAERSAADRATYFFYTLRTDAAVGDVAGAVLLKRLKVV
jgi:hypothetical protein